MDPRRSHSLKEATGPEGKPGSFPHEEPPLPDPPASLDSERAGRLTAQTRAALRRQRLELAAAIDQALAHIPAPLRGVVRRGPGA
jgi:hypothetical protein